MKLKIQPLCGLYFLLIAVFASTWACAGALLALFIHEAAHLLVGYGLGEQAESVELTPFGGIIRYPPGVSPKKGIRGMAVAAAGPLANYGMIGLLSAPWVQSVLPDEFLRQAIIMNTGMLALNILPVLPLDGGQAVFCVGYYMFPIGILTTVLSLGGMMVGGLMILLGVYGAFEIGRLNLSLLLVGAYLMAYAYRNRSALWMENLYAVLQERQMSEKAWTRVHIYRARGETRLFTLLNAIADSNAAIFQIEGEWVDEDRVISAMMQNPNAAAAELLEKSRQLS